MLEIGLIIGYIIVLVILIVILVIVKLTQKGAKKEPYSAQYLTMPPPIAFMRRQRRV